METSVTLEAFRVSSSIKSGTGGPQGVKYRMSGQNVLFLNSLSVRQETDGILK